VKARLHLHGHELLQEQFAGVRHVNLIYVLARVADTAVVFELFKVGFTEETTDRTDVDTVMIGDIEQSFFEETSTSMRDHAITLHFSKTKTTVSGTTFCRLSG
jgi:hypothetical protein